MENGLREDRARTIEMDKFRSILDGMKNLYVGNAFDARKYAQAASGTRDTNAPIFPSILCGNVMVDKCTMVFASLTFEVDFLLHEARSKYYNALLLYGEGADRSSLTNATNRRANAIEMMSNFLPLLYELFLFLGRCREVANNVLLQLHAFFNLKNDDFPNASDRSLTRIWYCLGDILSIFMAVDEIISSHPLLVEHWKIFVDSMQVIRHNEGKFLPDVESMPRDSSTFSKQLKPLLEILSQVQRHVLSARLFESFIGQKFDDKLASDRPFISRFCCILQDSATRWEKLARDDMPDKQRLTIIICLAILYYRITCRSASGTAGIISIDKKLVKSLWETQKYILTFHLVGDILWTPLQFFIRHMPNEAVAKAGIDRKMLIAFKQAKAELFNKQLELLPKEVEQNQEAVNDWKAEMKHCATNDITSSSGSNISVGNRCVCILKGARIADKISRLVKYFLNAGLAEDRVLTKTNVQHIFHLVELLKTISWTLNFHWPSILEWCAHARALWSSKLLAILDNVRSQVLSQSPNDPRVVDFASALQIATKTLCETTTRQRHTLCAIALELANYHKTLQPAEVTRVDDYLTRLDAISNIGLLLSRVCDCSFLYWHRSLVGVYFETSLFDQNRPIKNIQLFFDALSQCCSAPFLNSTRHLAPEVVRECFQREIFNAFRQKFLMRLCTEVETDLRLSCHQRQELSTERVENLLFPSNSDKSASSQTSVVNSEKLSRTLRLVQILRPACSDSNSSLELRVGSRAMNVREFVTRHIDATFYNLTTVALHDCETYTRMRTLARSRYSLNGLSEAGPHLPYMKVDQGLDIVMVMRKIHIFAENYAYDLNEQIFVERHNKSRAFNVLQVDQVVNSIKTHGVGILNSSVHFAYQYLKRKFQVFSQFLFDDQIKSRLVREIRFYRDHIDQLDQTYPLKRAEDLHLLIRKMGVSEDGKSFLDKFRELVTQVGNALGIIRMFRAGALESRDYTAKFVDECDVSELAKLLSDESPVASASHPHSQQIKNVISTLTTNVNDTFNSTDDFLEMLISVFSKEFRNYEKFSHLRNFFILIPALCVNYVEHIFACRNRLGKRVSVDESFTFADDGFSFGIAYILKLLNQGFFFHSLNWFDAVRMSLSDDVRTGRTQRTKLKDESLTQALAIKVSRAAELLDTYENLEHTLTTALIFFRVKEDSSSEAKQSADQQNQSAYEDEMYLEEF